ncbi:MULTISPECIES: tRNA (uridine(34)/cytosine(34)/5-carboxymethylaminomethyluridine(34)-2'-O)-methyltransferase TrmL [Bacillaceae]|jgi:tRNA (cytidine/uridine-2'-O-)-methyltransferase|uniref:Putative tRNA (cytidine(34)-2'-O)-methyltransferase n=2 Tax=Gottfriedia TaxID=2837503 RepID=A0ABY4JJ48_9BACI|nr:MULTISPECIES: tRNA (uridine(34)/cytosine(34)/5-carboxymethylaminomethyluridine(34)-2'-O)-methyltransferase TrmL [Bacillaceae]KQL41378.1 tRNA methyltransferase [Bacillus sp. FJAT-25509]ODG92502.1 tRNA (uridine(34)/cytosine(34)/5-carboxymethylaminomethyluridine(34)-2'-O)-methyltransferase TrmL [Gottfriedia luciferensis]PET67147.1 tRNA (uridine(34)/cytosine(34)/5-carboxymethylaminomethyluridine(34)-2'-O)-methyltransferase TrmL [Bacillus sp. AFS001701]PGZ92997.1 tRNA (uridine(34)/cytosine(34)/5-
MGIHVVLYQPQIPANTGNIARTCAGTDTSLHLIRPLGFSTDDKMLKRAGLDYWEHVDIHYHDSLDDLFDKYKDGKFYFITKFGEKTYSNFDYTNLDEEIFFVFGRETTGLPKELIEKNMETCLRIPMTDHIRSLNLSNTAAILIYEALRQQDFRELLKVKDYSK